ncbi:hypothetical protein [Acerihabitans sp.]|uniref:hypothetical protein n=1 Tax=Acerihabitans sp. TaxID=2811394 RepID=UPI002ED77971
MVNANAIPYVDPPYTGTEGRYPLWPSHCLDRLKNSLSTVMNTAIDMANSFYYVSRIAFTAANVCGRMYCHDLSALLKSVGNFTHNCATSVFFLQDFRVIRCFTVRAGRNQGVHGCTNMLISLYQWVNFLKGSHLPELALILSNNGDSDVTLDNKILAGLMSQSCSDIIKKIESENREYGKTVFLLKAFKKTVDFYIQLTELTDSISAILKGIGAKIKNGFSHVASVVNDFIIYPLLMALKNMAKIILMFLGHFIKSAPRQ